METNRAGSRWACHAFDMTKNRTPPTPKAIALGRRIALARAKIDMSQDTLARLVGVSKGAIGQYEIGLSTPRAPKFERLAGALGVTVEWLLTGDEPDEKARAQTQNELAALQLIRALPVDQQAAALAMLQGLLGSLSKS